MAPPAPADLEIHPLGQVIASVLEDGPEGAVVLTNEGFSYIRRALDEYLEAGDELMAAVDTVLVTAHVIEVQHGSREVAERLVSLVDRPEVIASMREIAEAAEARRAQNVAQSAEKFSKFRGDSPAQPPTLEDAPADPAQPTKPKGALRLGDLAFPKRL